jgi:hypothetical protein
MRVPRRRIDEQYRRSAGRMPDQYLRYDAVPLKRE